MKIIYSILLLISSFSSNQFSFVTNRKELISTLNRMQPGENLWIVGSLTDSFENKIFTFMKRESIWSELEDWDPLSFEDYVTMISNRGCTILHTETHRELVKDPLEWVSQTPSLFQNVFLSKYSQSGGIAKQVLMQITLPPITEKTKSKN